MEIDKSNTIVLFLLDRITDDEYPNISSAFIFAHLLHLQKGFEISNFYFYFKPNDLNGIKKIQNYICFQYKIKENYYFKSNDYLNRCFFYPFLPNSFPSNSDSSIVVFIHSKQFSNTETFEKLLQIPKKNLLIINNLIDSNHNLFKYIQELTYSRNDLLSINIKQCHFNFLYILSLFVEANDNEYCYLNILEYFQNDPTFTSEKFLLPYLFELSPLFQDKKYEYDYSPIDTDFILQNIYSNPSWQQYFKDINGIRTFKKYLFNQNIKTLDHAYKVFKLLQITNSITNIDNQAILQLFNLEMLSEIQTILHSKESYELIMTISKLSKYSPNYIPNVSLFNKLDQNITIIDTFNNFLLPKSFNQMLKYPVYTGSLVASYFVNFFFVESNQVISKFGEEISTFYKQNFSKTFPKINTQIFNFRNSKEALSFPPNSQEFSFENLFIRDSFNDISSCECVSEQFFKLSLSQQLEMIVSDIIDHTKQLLSNKKISIEFSIERLNNEKLPISIHINEYVDNYFAELAKLHILVTTKPLIEYKKQVSRYFSMFPLKDVSAIQDLFIITAQEVMTTKYNNINLLYTYKQ